METDLLFFDKNNFLYFFAHKNGFGWDLLWVVFLGWIIFWLTKTIDKKNSYNTFNSLGFNCICIGLLLFLSIIIAFLYQGIFEIWIMMVFSLMLLLGLIDWEKFAVPDWMNLTLFFIMILGVVFFENNHDVIAEKIFGALSLAGLFSILRILGDIFSKKEVLGEADIIFVASIGMLLGISNALIAIVCGCVFGTLGVMILRIFGKRVTKIPMISVIILGIAFCFGIGIYHA